MKSCLDATEPSNCFEFGEVGSQSEFECNVSLSSMLFLEMCVCVFFSSPAFFVSFFVSSVSGTVNPTDIPVLPKK